MGEFRSFPIHFPKNENKRLHESGSARYAEKASMTAEMKFAWNPKIKAMRGHWQWLRMMCEIERDFFFVASFELLALFTFNLDVRTYGPSTPSNFTQDEYFQRICVNNKPKIEEKKKHNIIHKSHFEIKNILNITSKSFSGNVESNKYCRL